MTKSRTFRYIACDDAMSEDLHGLNKTDSSHNPEKADGEFDGGRQVALCLQGSSFFSRFLGDGWERDGHTGQECKDLWLETHVRYRSH